MNGNCSKGSLWSDPVYAAAFGLTFVAGLVLNSLALVFFFRFTQIRSQTTVYMKNLACADLLLVASLPIRCSFYILRQPFPQLLCELTGLIFLVNMYASIFFLTCISLDRCVAVCFPMKSVLSRLRRQAHWYSVGVWVLVVGASLPPYLHIKLAPRHLNASCILCFDQRPNYITQPTTLAFTLLVGCGLPLATILACSLALMRTVRRSSAARMDYIDWRKIRNMVVANVVIFTVCFLPYHVLLLLLKVWPSQKDRLLAAYLAAVPLACSNTVLDPLSYYFATETFQRSLGIQAMKMALTTNTESDGHDRVRGNT
ncbi:lysophosphatidic acid receptor 6 [Narcine bancroftii]|uniref:lysophosphatidic acid receptor 6 n=1 Tax=Narcine bancroftii TaxID=1343680 RepID=UPI0038318099